MRRIIDANTNRAREALRVMEEAARFLLEDAALTGDLKGLRHDLAAAVAAAPALEGLALARDVENDPGTAISTPSERQRASAGEVVVASAKRLTEALRALEEYGKTLDADFAASMEQLRYRAYALEQRLVLACGAAERKQWRVCVLFTPDACGPQWRAVLESILDADPDAVQLREKDVDDAVRLERAKLVVQLAPPGTRVIVNDRPDLALLAGADGVHLGQGDLPCAAVRRWVGPRLHIGVSTSCLAEAEAARRDGADVCGVGPMFPSTTKAKDRIAGPEYLDAFVRWGGLPHLAIGGIAPENIARLTAVGARGVAVSAAVCGAPDPGAVVRLLQSALDQPSNCVSSSVASGETHRPA